jgi:hypothetical protein
MGYAKPISRWKREKGRHISASYNTDRPGDRISIEEEKGLGRERVE